MTNLENITRFHIADSIHNEFGLPKKDCIDLANKNQIFIGTIDN